MKVNQNEHEKGCFSAYVTDIEFVAGFMAWSIISPLMPFISQDVDISPDKYLSF